MKKKEKEEESTILFCLLNIIQITKQLEQYEIKNNKL
jgi:hypothetical protein